MTTTACRVEPSPCGGGEVQCSVDVAGEPRAGVLHVGQHGEDIADRALDRDPVRDARHHPHSFAISRPRGGSPVRASRRCARPPSTTSVPLTRTCSMPSGNSPRLVVGRVHADGRRVEDDDVGEHPVAQQAALREPEPRRRRAGHLVDRGLERQERLVADELPEDPRERAVGARRRLLAEEGRVRADHPDRVRHEQRQRLRPRPARDLGDAEVLGQQQVADRVDGVPAGLGHHLGHASATPSAGGRAG